MADPKCKRCDGTGRYFCAPYGINPFNVKLPQLVQMLEERKCDCRTALSPSTEQRS